VQLGFASFYDTTTRFTNEYKAAVEGDRSFNSPILWPSNSLNKNLLDY